MTINYEAINVYQTKRSHKMSSHVQHNIFSTLVLIKIDGQTIFAQ